MKKRDVAINIILSIITCGIYSLVWLVNIADDVNYLSKNKNVPGINVLLLTIVTCGIYGLYWAYTTGNLLDEIKNKYGINSSNSGIIYILLNLFSGGLFTLLMLAIIQNDLNRLIDLDIEED